MKSGYSSYNNVLNAGSLYLRSMQNERNHLSYSIRRQFGSLKYISPIDFVDSINAAKEGEIALVHLYHPDNYACELINNHLERIANLHPKIQACTLYIHIFVTEHYL